MLTTWAIALQNYDFTVQHVPGRLNVVPNALSQVFSEVDGEKIPPEPPLAAICRNVPDQPFHPPAPRDYEVSANNVDEIAPVKRIVSYSRVPCLSSRLLTLPSYSHSKQKNLARTWIFSSCRRRHLSLPNKRSTRCATSISERTYFPFVLPRSPPSTGRLPGPTCRVHVTSETSYDLMSRPPSFGWSSSFQRHL